MHRIPDFITQLLNWIFLRQYQEPSLLEGLPNGCYLPILNKLLFIMMLISQLTHSAWKHTRTCETHIAFPRQHDILECLPFLPMNY